MRMSSHRKSPGTICPPCVLRLETRSVHSLETEIAFPGMGTRSLRITCVPLLDDNGEVREVMGITHDYTRRKNYEKEIERLNRMYVTLSELNRLIVHVQSREELFREVCRITVAHAGYTVVWVGWIDRATQRITPIAQSGKRAGYIAKIAVYIDDRPRGTRPRGNLRPLGPALRHHRSCQRPTEPSLARAGGRSSAPFRRSHSHPFQGRDCWRVYRLRRGKGRLRRQGGRPAPGSRRNHLLCP